MAHSRQKPCFRGAGGCGGQRAWPRGTEGTARTPGSGAAFMKMLIVLCSSTVNNEILISAYQIAFFSYVGVSEKFIVINVSRKFTA